MMFFYDCFNVSCGDNMFKCRFYQNLHYTCANSELQLFLICLFFMLTCIHYMHTYELSFDDSFICTCYVHLHVYVF